MEKIKKLEDVILSPQTLLAEVLKPKRYIVSPDGTEDKDSYGVVIAKHETVTDIEIGDFVIKYTGSMNGYTLNAGKSNERMIVVMNRGNVTVAVKPDNFINPDILMSKISV